MSSHGPSFEDKVAASIDAVKDRSLPGMARNLAFAGIAWGVAGLGYGFMTSPEWTWGAWLATSFFFLCMGQGAVMFAVILHGTKAHWGRPLKRIAESFAVVLPIAWLALLVFLIFGTDTVYSWSPAYTQGDPTALAPHGQAPAAKEFWLAKGFFEARQLGYVALMMLLDFLFIRNSIGPDLKAAADRLGGPVAGWWSTFMPSGDAAEAFKSGDYRNEAMLPVMGFGYAILWSLLAFDLIMSVDPWWFSNMFGGWIFMSSILLGMASIGFTAVVGKDWLDLGPWLKPHVTHDLGKLILAGTMFWGYTLFAQILPIYYTNVPEETNFLLVRLMLPQWAWYSQLVAVLVFLAPFTMLLSRGLKKMHRPFVALTCLTITGLFLERSLLVLPSTYLEDTFPTVLFLVTSFGLFAGGLGVTVLAVGSFLSKVPSVPVADPRLDEHPWEGHIHAFDASHAAK